MIENVINTNKSAYVFGTNGRQRIIEERERLAAKDFFDFFEIEIIGNNVPEKNIVDRLFSLVRKHKEPLDLSYHEDINDELINKICKQVKCVPPLDLFKQN